MTLLMTGGTGFLGLHLLRGHLLAGRHVTVLAHAGSSPAFDRVERFLVSSGQLDRLPSPLTQLMSVVDVDIQLPMLGLAPTEYHALARSADELWHVAASVVLDGRDDAVWRSNFLGTENILRLAERMPRHAPIRHVSTAFVAGQLRQGDVRESDSAKVTAFENTYERSKHAAEDLVRQRAAATDRSVLILRPSILVPGALPVEGLPEHTLRTIGRIVSRVAERVSTPDSRLVLRVGADPRAHLNLLQVDWAADAMLRLGDLVRDGVHTMHVVHHTDVPVRAIAAALEDVASVRLRMMPAPPTEPADSERWLYQRAAGFLPYLYHRRHFTAAAARTVLADVAPPPFIDRAHLRDCFRPVGTVRASTGLRKSA
jgi:thioester reductase-like protein